MTAGAAALLKISEHAAQAAEAANASTWRLHGNYFEACSCETVCPCIFESAPSHGDCNVIYAWTVRTGHYRDVSLDGLNVALAARADGHMQQVKWLAALYIDSKATPDQYAALESIFTGKAGGHPAALASFFERFIGVRQVPISFEGEGKKRSVDIPGVLKATIKAIVGQKGGETTIVGQPLGLAPGEPLVAAKSDEVVLKDYEWNWKFSGRAGGYSPFTYQSA
ncbi:DUF1326 domain-containing protein [Hyphomicrobium sp. CS1GBMeth3]|uniref:DUF1326 domain-containing protein n=1 Tax=Hyphomicrobium sp. CS1GBMeth3 TaxID=1892845 RepID=UPI0009FA8D8A|nr:DUF1326 domain-containing protein [Hyphomicrobium sp. CS1GBMeth3]